MNKILFDNIRTVIGIQNELTAHFYFHEGECEIHFEKNYLNSEGLFVLLKEWFYEELKDKLVELDAYADSICCTFKQQNKKLLCHLTLMCSDDDYNDNERHSKEEILNEAVLSIVTNKIEHFDIELIDFSFTYHVGFDHFKIYYANEKVQLDDQEEGIIKLEIEKIISEWKGVFWGKGALEINKFIEMDTANYFKCYDLVDFEFEIKK